MKITVKPKQTEKDCSVPFNDIPVGMVYVIGSDSGPVCLKLHKGEVAVLRYTDKIDAFNAALSFKDKSAYKILGKLSEVIVEER